MNNTAENKVDFNGKLSGLEQNVLLVELHRPTILTDESELQFIRIDFKFSDQTALVKCFNTVHKYHNLNEALLFINAQKYLVDIGSVSLVNEHQNDGYSVLSCKFYVNNYILI